MSPQLASTIEDLRAAATVMFKRIRSQSSHEKDYKTSIDDVTASISGELSTGSKSDEIEKRTQNDVITLTNIPPQDATKCLAIMESLTESEIEIAARSSYEYFRYSEPNPEGGKVHEVDHNMRNMYAMKMARRHLVAEKGSIALAKEKMKKTIAFRKEMSIDAMRQCFYKLNYEESKLLAETRKGIDKELSDGKHIVRGHDMDQHSFLIIFPRRYSSFDNDWYLKGKLYSLERAIACTERISGGKVEKVNVVFDYEGYRADKHEPPLSLIKELLFCLRDHYPERLQHMYFVNAPLRFRAFWAMLKPFIDPVTKRKIQFVSGNNKKRNVFHSSVSSDQAMRFMHLDGLKPDDYDIEKWTYMIPFDHDVDGGYDSSQNK